MNQQHLPAQLDTHQPPAPDSGTLPRATKRFDSSVHLVGPGRGKPVDPAVAQAALGLLEERKHLPFWLFYDDEGSRLYERITQQPEYYPTRVEQSILDQHADRIIDHTTEMGEVTVMELGAGSAMKTEGLLRRFVVNQGKVTYVPSDISSEALIECTVRFAMDWESILVRSCHGRHEVALERMARMPERKLVLFLGSSLGNFDDAGARDFVRSIRESLQPGDFFLLGTDRKKDPAILQRAYDDAAGVTAAFNRNLLVRLNRELGCNFDPRTFRHVALWNTEASRVEMHLESLQDQEVYCTALDRGFRFASGERIFTEASRKYTETEVDALLQDAGFSIVEHFTDDQKLFGLALARAE